VKDEKTKELLFKISPHLGLTYLKVIQIFYMKLNEHIGSSVGV